MMRPATKAWLVGIAAAALILGLYLLIMTLTSSWTLAWLQYRQLRWWMTPLVILFGLQAGLFAYLRAAIKTRHAAGAATGAVAASGGVSTGSMVACCLHHVSDVIPIIGLSGAALFLNRYQEAFLLLGILSSLLGLAWMLRTAQEHGITDGVLGFTAKARWRTLFPLMLFASLFLLATRIFIMIRV